SELFNAGIAKHILLCGDGRRDKSKRALLARDFPEAQLELESRSQSTKENAEFSIPILRSNGVKRAVLVTSWYHSRRALSCFRHFAPEIRFISAPAPRAPVPVSTAPWLREKNSILKEYLKSTWYFLRYGISLAER